MTQPIYIRNFNRIIKTYLKPVLLSRYIYQIRISKIMQTKKMVMSKMKLKHWHIGVIIKIILWFVTSISIAVIVASCEDITKNDRNSPPEILSLVADRSEIEPYQQTVITCSAIDNDGDSLTYFWNSNGGSISGFGRRRLSSSRGRFACARFPRNRPPGARRVIPCAATVGHEEPR